MKRVRRTRLSFARSSAGRAGESVLFTAPADIRVRRYVDSGYGEENRNWRLFYGLSRANMHRAYPWRIWHTPTRPSEGWRVSRCVPLFCRIGSMSHSRRIAFLSRLETYLAFFFVAFFFVPFFLVAFFLAMIGLHKRNKQIQLRHHRRLYTFFEPDAYAFAYARFFHRDAV